MAYVRRDPPAKRQGFSDSLLRNTYNNVYLKANNMGKAQQYLDGYFDGEAWKETNQLQ